MIGVEPRLGGPVSGSEIPPVDYLSWYVPRLQEQRPYDLSQSGFGYDWGVEADIDTMLTFWKSGQDPRQWVADRYGVELDQVCIAHGACQSISLAILAALPEDGPRAVGVEMPSFAVVSQSARLLGCEVIPFHRGPNEGPWKLNREQVLEILPKVGVLALTPVMNPTGEMISEDDQKWLIEVTQEAGVNIVSDEVYLDAAKGTEFYRPMYKIANNSISINSLTKTYGLGPIRFGWMIGDPDLILNAKRPSKICRVWPVHQPFQSPSRYFQDWMKHWKGFGKHANTIYPNWSRYCSRTEFNGRRHHLESMEHSQLG